MRRPPPARRHQFVDFLKSLLGKAEEDLIFFMAGAISFNVLVAFIPLLLFTVGISGIVVSARFGDPGTAIHDLLARTLPAMTGDLDLVDTIRDQVMAILAQRRNFTVLGSILLVWLSTRLVGTLRAALREIFDIAQARGIVRGKLFDVQVVLIGGLLFLVNMGATAAMRTAEAFGVELLGLQGPALSFVQAASAQTLAIVSIWLLFLGVYRYLPARRLPWKTALIAATFTALLHELLKAGFGWYVTSVADYRTTYGNLITLAVLFFWIYYEAMGFILGGEVAQVWTMRRARHVTMRDALFGVDR